MKIIVIKESRKINLEPYGNLLNFLQNNIYVRKNFLWCEEGIEFVRVHFGENSRFLKRKGKGEENENSTFDRFFMFGDKMRNR